MTATAILIREIETLPKESLTEAISYITFLKNKTIEAPQQKRISIENAFGIFKELQGIDTSIEREENDRL